MILPINNLKLLIKILADIIIVYTSLYLAISINAERFLPFSKSYFALGLIIISIQVTTLYLLNVYSEFTKFFDYENIIKILSSLFLTSIFLIIISYLAIDNTKIFFRFLNIKILILYSSIFIFLNLSIKIFAKNFLFKKEKIIDSKSRKKYVIYGAGRTGMEIIKILKNYNNINILYFIDDDKNKIGRTIDGIEVFSSKQIELDNKKIDTVLICMPSASSFEIKNIEANLINLKILHKNISSLDDFLNNTVAEKDKLIKFDHDTILDLNFSNNIKDKFKNKKVLVTGASGTIGKEIMFQISRLDVQELIGLDFNELNISNLKKDFDNLKINNKIKKYFYLINLNNKSLLNYFIEKHKPDYIFHAAAYKHVDIVETNAVEAVSNNLISLINILECTKNLTNLNFIFISTDKAVKPINQMGKSKRLGEIIVSGMNNINKNNNYTCVRFGNVIGSSGSLIPILNDQISKGGPITITDKMASRYFMTVQDAVSLTIETSNMESRGLINVLNMGKPINIYSMVMKILKDSNIDIYSDDNKEGIRIDIIGLRPGEKLHEELFHSDKVIKTDNEKIFSETCDFNFRKEDIEKIKENIYLANSKNDINIFNKMFSEYF